jgi:GNAT superfamily N-acetyltransferase
MNICPDASVQACAGGYLIYCGAESPLTHALGLGMHGPVSLAEIDEVERFFRRRGAPATIDVSAHADPSLREALSTRGYHVVEISNVLVRGVSAALADYQPPDGITIRKADPEEYHLYARTVMTGFFSRSDVNDAELRIGYTMFHMPCTTPLLTFHYGNVAGGCALSVRNRVASLFGDATLPGYRSKGLHAAAIAHRLAIAAREGCDLATAGTQPGSQSQRNYQRLGFEVAYSKVTMMRRR